MKGKSSKIGNDLGTPSETYSVRLGVDSSTFPFQEWSDEEVRAENWKSIVTLQPDQKTDRSSSSPDRVHDTTGTPTGDPDAVNEALFHFKDEQVVHLPYSIVAYEWQPASQVFSDARLEVYVKKNNYPDLINANKHLLHSEFMRSFISSVHTLMYLGNTTRFAVEYVTSKFTPTTTGEPWKPWHHVYSNSFAGTKHPHEPTINKNGKYIVRLFWMGAWRKIYVDDRLPMDLLKHVMLPSLSMPDTSKEGEIEKQKVKIVELWPFLLAKALLKIASLSWYEDREMVDFDIVECLTGWHPQRINTKGLPISDIWQICWANTNHFSWPSEKPSSRSTSQDKVKQNNPAKGNKVDKQMEDGVTGEASSRCCMVARCNDLRNFADSDELLNIFPCWDHHFLIDQTRDVPLRKPTMTADQMHWKKWRWLSWAAERGMISTEELLPEIKCYKLVSPFRKVSEYVMYNQPSKAAISYHPPAPAVSKVKIPAKKTKDKGKEKESQKGDKSSKKSDDVKAKPNMKKSTSNIKSDMPDPSFWVDYEALSHQINTLMVYYKPSTFKTKIEISDSSQKGQIERKGSTHEWHVLPKPLILGKCRNEPFYIFSESMDTERIIINLSQMGYTDILYPEETSERSITVTEKFTECDFCLASLVKRVKGNITKEEVKDYISVKKIEQVLVKHYRSVSHIVVEEFNWKTDKLGATVTSMNTYGAKTTTLSLPPGRKTLKLWIKSDTPCTVQIFSDALVTIGGLETILTAMLAESKLLEDMCIQVANCFGNLVEAFGTPEFPSKLKAFYESYKPQESLTKAESVLVHDKFYCLLYELVEENPNKEEAYALKVLLFRWQLPLYKEYPENYDLCSCYNEVDLEFLKVTEQYAVRIQAFFRGVYERCLMKRHSMSHKGYKSTTENLLNIYSTIFSVESRFNMCPNLIRTFLAHPDMEKLKKKYNIFHDLENVLTLKQIEGIVKIIENQWTFLCRHQFCVTSKNPIPIRINLFCNIDEYVVRVIDNDTNEEIRRYTNNVAVNEYKPNLRGYTVFCYAWPTSSQNLSYRLTFASKKEVDCDRFTLLTDSPNNFILQGMYIPNVNDTVCKYLVNVRSEHALISINFVPCFEDAVLNLRLCDSQNRVVKELTGKGRVLFPAICLKNQNKSSNDPVAAKSSINTIKKGRVPSKLSQKMQDKKPRQSVQIKKLRLKVEDQRSGTGSQGYEPRLQPSGSIYARAKPPSPQWSGKDLGKNLNVEEPVVYRIEVTVLDDSWPLNAAEWRSVENMKSHKPEPVQEKVVLGVSTSSLKKQLKQRSLMRTSKPSLPKPYWIMEIVHNRNDWVEFVEDKRRQAEIAEMKSMWSYTNIKRSINAQKLRRIFLEENEFPNPDLPNEETDIRSLDKTAFATKILPPFDLVPYMIKDPKEVGDNRIFKNANALRMEDKRESAVIDEARKRHQLSTEKMDKFMDQQVESLDIINKWFWEVRQESSLMMDHVMKLREKFMEVDAEMKDKTIKKGKKDKKG